MKKEIKIHYNPYANDFPMDKRLPKTICGQKNNGNETHIKDGVTCSVCKTMFNNVDKFMNGGLQEILEDENRIKRMSFEEMENYERVSILNQQNKYNRFNIVDKHFYIQGEKVIAYTTSNKFLGESIPGKKSKSTILEMVGDKLIFLYGKYKGMDLKDIEDMKYLTWVTTLYKVKSEDRKLIKKFIETKTGEKVI